MLTRRIIPCLDIADGRVVKGVKFKDLKDAGDPVELALRYNADLADELVFLDIHASHENRGTTLDLVRRVAECLFIPFTIGGGVRSLADMEALLRAGADKVALNTAAVRNPQLVADAAKQFGSQFVMVSMDVFASGGGYKISTTGSRDKLDVDALDWARRVCELGAGEILLNVIDADGTRSGYALDITRAVSTALPIPVIASGGAGKMDDFATVFNEGRADAALAAGVFHFGDMTVSQVKQFLQTKGIPVRL